MKNLIRIFCIAILTLLGGEINGQEYFEYFKNQDFSIIAKHLDDQVNIQVNRDKRIVTKQTAIEILRNNISSFNPISWELMHEGSSEGKKGNYFIAKMYNTSEEGMRLFVHLDGQGKGQKIISIRLRKLL